MESTTTTFSAPQHPRTSAAFTLIELLTVIAIIGILAAIIIPVVGKVRNTAKFSVNVSNVRQWTVACSLHMADWKGYMPYQGTGTGGSGGLQLQDLDDVTPFTVGGVLPWWNALPKYIGMKTLRELKANNALPKVGDGSFWVSPLAETPPANMEWASFLCYSTARSSNTMASAQANRFVANIGNLATRNGANAAPIKVSPSKTVAFAETALFTKALSGSTPFSQTSARVTVDPVDLAHFNRNGSNRDRGGLEGKAAVGFFDGSVRTFSGAQLAAQAGAQPGGNSNNAAQRGTNPDGVVWRLTPN
jgi:prepilin-type N-terminal cleavage/methylation domain-containing protein